MAISGSLCIPFCFCFDYLLTSVFINIQISTEVNSYCTSGHCHLCEAEPLPPVSSKAAGQPIGKSPGVRFSSVQSPVVRQSR